MANKYLPQVGDVIITDTGAMVVVEAVSLFKILFERVGKNIESCGFYRMNRSEFIAMITAEKPRVLRLAA